MKQAKGKWIALVLMLASLVSLFCVPSLAAGKGEAEVSEVRLIRALLADVKEEFTEAAVIGDYCEIAFDKLESIKEYFFVIFGVLALVLCFFGYRLLRLMLAVGGFFGGFWAGLHLYSAVLRLFGGLPAITELVLAGICAVGGAILCHFMFRVAIFAGAGYAAFVVAEPFFAEMANGSLYRVLAAIGVAVLSVLLLKFFYIIGSGFGGGILAVWLLGSKFEIFSKVLYRNDAIFNKLPVIEGITLAVAIGAVIGLLGVIFQFSNTRRRRV